MVFQIDRETGTFSYQRFTLPANMTFEEFQKQHPELKVETEYRDGPGQYVRHIPLPVARIANHDWHLSVRFRNLHVDSVDFDSADMKSHEFEEDSQAPWWQKAFEWLRIAREIFQNQLGEPERKWLRSYLMYGEGAFLSEAQRNDLVNWDYRFPWGWAWLGYDTENLAVGAYLLYDFHQRITSWDELLAEHRYMCSIEETHGERYPGNWLVTEETLKLLQEHFDFEPYHPLSSESAVSFGLRGDPNSVVVDIRPECPEKYRLWRPDSTRKVYADDSTLVETLREFLETENLD